MLDIYKQILIGILSNQDELTRSLDRFVEMRALEMLHKIKTIIEDDSLKDAECFMRIEKIVETFEAAGCGCYGRHDFR